MDKSLIIKVIAAVCIYLVASISTASAIEITIYRQVVSGGVPQPNGETATATLDYGNVIDKQFDFVFDPGDTRYENVQVKVSVMGKDPAYTIKRIYLFKCKDATPLDCVDYAPVEAVDTLSGAKGTFSWKDVSRNAKANFLTIVKFTVAGSSTESWVGYWDEAVRTSVSDFSHEAYDVSDMKVYALPGKDPQWIKEFIEKHQMIPMNWADRVVLGPVNGHNVGQMYVLLANKTDIEMASFRKSLPDGNSISLQSLTKDYLLSFGKGSIANPVTIFANPTPPCGDGQCDISETTETCCLDCGCPTAGQDCTATPSYPNGLCHTCGDGSISPVENWTNCCADAGCAAKGDDSYCVTDVDPDGFCTTPKCPNGDCEPPEWTAAGYCAPDCYSTIGHTCANVFGSDYYYKGQKCVRAVCGNSDCEAAGGETYLNCCADCNSCPTGQYCDKITYPGGQCTTPSCSYNNPTANPSCESGETAGNCCTDCECSGDLQCEENVCHKCGNDIYEKPVETEENCCKDTSCSTPGEYCTLLNDCKNPSEMGLTVSMLPSEMDCQSAGATTEIRFTPVNGPYHLISYYRVVYIYDGSMYTLKTCSVQGDAYVCQLPTSGPDTFRGCYGGTGQKAVSFIASVRYYEDAAGKIANEGKQKDVTLPFSINVKKAKTLSCNKDGTCDDASGETASSCCYDCGCDGTDICTDSGCKAEGDVNLAVLSVPTKSEIDCQDGLGDEAVFSMKMENMPGSSADPFKIVSYSLEYKGKKYTSRDMPGFECKLPTGAGAIASVIDCTLPVAYFPACQDASDAATMNLYMGILGGGLSGTYPPYDGMVLKSDDIEFVYKHGLPKCGDGIEDTELGETEDTCCMDTGCSTPGEYCTLLNDCKNPSEMGFDVSMQPIEMDCTATGMPTEITFTPLNAPYKDFFISYYRVAYAYDGSMYTLGTCSVQGDAYVCQLPTSGPDTFRGCYGVTGNKAVSFTVSVKYYEDAEGKAANEGKQKDVTLPFSINVKKIKIQSCNKDGTCDDASGETASSCCYDCGCDGSGICTDLGCRPKGDVKLSVLSVPTSKNDIDCQNNPSAKAVFSMKMENMPGSSADPFTIVSYSLEYGAGTNKKNYTSRDMPGFDCKLPTGAGASTGVIDCTLPVAYFPACPDGSDAATMNLYMGILGGGLSGTYPPYDGMLLKSDNIHFVYRHGLPMCGDGNADPELGETEDTCCRDVPCSVAGEVCTSAGSCEPLTSIGVEVSTDPIVDCNIEGDIGKQKKFTIDIDIKEDIMPYASGGIILDDVFIGETGKQKKIDGMGGSCDIKPSGTGWECLIPITEFVPFCFEGGDHTVKVSTTLSWHGTGTATIRKDVNEDVKFNIKAREKVCNGIGGCEEKLGESKENCCWDCGCAAGDICTRDSEDDCVGKEKVTLTATATPKSLNCKSVGEDDKLSIELVVTNHPYDIAAPVKWQIDYEDEDGNWVRLNEMRQDCSEELGLDQERTGNYLCEIPVRFFPPCAKTGDNRLNITARMQYMDATGNKIRIEPSDIETVTVSEAGVPNCGMGGCEPGETKDNCCYDCGCDLTKGNVCTEGGSCVNACPVTGNCDFKLAVTSVQPSVTCQMNAGNVVDNFVKDYGCIFQDSPLELNAMLNIMPANARVTSATYTWVRDVYVYNKKTGTGSYEQKIGTYKDVNPQETAGGWKLGIILNPDGKYIITDETTRETTIKDVTLTVESTTPGTGETRAFKVKALDKEGEGLTIYVSPVKNDGLLAYEEVLQSIRDAMEKANKQACAMTVVAATCVICSLMADAGTADPEQATKAKEKATKIQDVETRRNEEIEKEKAIVKARCTDEDTGKMFDRGNYRKDWSMTSDAINPTYDAELAQLEKDYPTQPKQPGSINFGQNTQIGLFSQLMNVVEDGDMLGSGIAGLIGAGVFYYLMDGSVMDCKQSYINSMLGATAFCGLMLAFGQQTTLRALARMCDMMTTAMQLMKTITGMQRSQLDYQMCLVAAEAELSRGQVTTDPYQTALRTTNYYQRSSQCHQTSMDRMTAITNDFAMTTYGMTQYVGGYGDCGAVGITMNPMSGRLGPGGKGTLDMCYYFQPSGNIGGNVGTGVYAGNYGNVNINARYQYAPGQQPVTVQQRIPLGVNTGKVTCTVNDQGVNCLGPQGNPYDLPACNAQNKCATGGTISVGSDRGGTTRSYDFVPSAAQSCTGSDPSGCGGNCNQPCGSGKICSGKSDCMGELQCISQVCG